jgi:predicted RNA binding protein YcfA (HicA-like mRNA interferase family)
MLCAQGWYEVARRGIHMQLKHALRSGRVTVPHPSRPGELRVMYEIEPVSVSGMS